MSAPTATTPGPTAVRGIALAYIASLPLSGLVVSELRSVSAVLGIVMIVAWLLAGRGVATPRSRPAQLVYLSAYAYLGMAAVTLAGAINPTQGIQSLATAVGVVLTVPVLVSVLSPVSTLPVAVLAASSTLLAGSLWAQLGSDPFVGEVRITALSLNPNQAARFAAIGIFAALWCMLRVRGWHRGIFLMMATVCLVGALSTGSRTTLIAVGVAFLAFLVQTLGSSQWRRGGLGLLGLALAAFTLAFVFVQDMLPQRLSTTADALAAGQLNYREVVWSTTLDNSELWLLHGVGIGNSGEFTASVLGIPLVMHNALLEAAVELGILGVVVFGAFCVGLFAAARQSPYARFTVPVTVLLFVYFSSGSIFLYKEVWLIVAFALVAPISSAVSPAADPPRPTQSLIGRASPRAKGISAE